MPKPFRLVERVRSFRYAFEGIAVVLRSQHNAWIHGVATVAVVTTGLLLDVSAAEWCWLVMATSSVWAAECFNTAFEALADVASPEFHPLVKKAKDIAAGAVLVAALGAAIIGLLVFVPYVA